MPKLYLSNEELNNIIQDYQSGLSMAAITRKYHHDKNTLKRYFQDHNINLKIRNISESLAISQDKKEADALKRKYHVNDDYFSNQNSKMAYFLGFLMADGNVSSSNNRVQICLNELDSSYLEMYYNEIGGSPIHYYTVSNNKYQTCRWECISAKIKQDLISYDVVPNKTGLAKIPQKLDKRFYPDFIRGYFDGDGSIYIEKNGAVGFEIVSHNKEILEQILDYFEENNIPRANITVDNRANINYRFKYRKNTIKKIYNLLYYDTDILYMKRKFDKFIEIF